MEVREEISGKSDEGLGGGGERNNVPAVPLARISTRATEAIKNDSGYPGSFAARTSTFSMDGGLANNSPAFAINAAATRPVR
jgi:hypothetical protein